MQPKRTPSASSSGASSADQHDADAPGVHLITFTHEGRFWDVFLKVVEDPGDPDSCRARLRFLPADAGDHEEPVETAVVIIEPSYSEALETARGYDRHHLAAMLRSVS